MKKEIWINLAKNLLSIILLFVFLAWVFNIFQTDLFKKEKEISITQLADQINKENVKEIKLKNDKIFIEFNDQTKAISRKEPNLSFSETLINYGAEKEKIKKVNVQIQEPGGDNSWWISLIIFGIAPLILLGLFFWYLIGQAKGGAMQAFDFTKAKAKILGPGGETKEKITFKDIAGLKEAKEELKEVIDFLKNPKKYQKIGARVPRGVLLVGPPGCGKTMLAKAVANESNVPFFSISGSEFIELFVGVGASRVRSLFEQARRSKKAIIFVDEIDSIGKIRGVGITGGHEEREQTLNQLLAEMDGIGREENIIVMGATNRPEYLDPALLRPGRFDRRIVLDLPDVKEREGILKIHSRGKPLAMDVDLKEVAERTPGFSGADLANVVNEAAILAARKNKSFIFQADFLEAIEKVLLGPERKSHLLTKEEKKIAAYHEAGHAIVSRFLGEEKEVRKISIISRGMAAGYTLTQPKEEKRIKRKKEILAEISVLLGGYVAEKIKFGEISTGASNDLEMATQLAQKVVKEYGMSKLGPISYGKREKAVFLGIETEERNYSEKVAFEIDNEIKKIINEAEESAQKIIKKQKKVFENLAKTLIEKETIEKEEFEKLIKETTKRT